MGSEYDELMQSKDEIEFDERDIADQIEEWEREGRPDEKMAPKSKVIIGAAGSGKTTKIKEAIKKDKSIGVLCATTGIAAINLGEGVTTINSLLGFYDVNSLKEAFLDRRLHQRLERVYKMYKNIIVDEVSMMGSEVLDYIWKGIEGIQNLSKYKDKEIGLVLVGDFCQLPPVKAKFCFEGEGWEDGRFDENILKLDKCYRQSDPLFLEAMRYARKGDGKNTVEALSACKVEFGGKTLDKWDGVTLFGINTDVDRYNWSRLHEIEGKKFQLTSRRVGKQAGEWKLIPETMDLKIGAYVMILSNDTTNWTYANGTCGEVVEWNGESVGVLLNNGKHVHIGRILRSISQKEKPDDIPDPEDVVSIKEWAVERGYIVEGKRVVSKEDIRKGYKARLRKKSEEYKEAMIRRHGKPIPYYNYEEKRWVIGEISYYPLRLAWATTVHKSQGLTLERVQIDVKHKFFEHPGMVYVALSRVKSPEGLRIVGNEKLLANRIKVDSRVKDWI